MFCRSHRILLNLFLLLALSSGAQDLPSSYKKMNGLLSNVVYCVFQDNQGYVWVGTEAGVSRYDGYNFRHFSKDDGLSDNDIFQIKEDRKGRLWFLTYNGEPTIYDKGKILTPKNCSFLSRVIPGSMATGFVEKGDSISFITLNRIYLFVKDSLVKIIQAPLYSEYTYGNSFFLQGLVWNNSIYYIHQKGFLKPGSNKSIPFSDSIMLSMSSKMYLSGNTLVAINSGRVSIIDMQTGNGRIFHFSKGIIPLSVWPSPQPGILWVFTNQDIYIYNTGEKSLIPYAGLKMPSITSVLRDREGNTWLGSLTNGLYFSGNYQTGIINYTTAAGTKTAYSMQVFKDVVYAGYANAEFSGCNRAGIIQKPEDVKQFATPPRVYGFYAGPASLWVAVGNKAIELSASGKVVRELGISTKALNVNRGNELYAALSYNVIKLNLDTIPLLSKIANFANVKTIYNGRVNHIYSNNTDTIVLGTLSGLVMIVHDKMVPNAFPDKPVFKTTVTKVIGTRFGMAFSTLGEGVGIITKDSVYVLNKNNGLINNSCNNIYAAGDTLWVAATLGLSRVIITRIGKKLEFDIKNYSESHGFPSGKINDVLVHHDTVWIATENGVCFFNAKKSGSDFPPPSLVLEEMLVNGQPVNWTQSLSLGYESNNIRIRFTGISFFSNGAVTYRYKLEGAEEKWNTTTSRDVEYPALTPGKYRFLVMAANADGEWTKTPLQIDFEITPPFWKTWWFRLLLILFSLAIFLVVARYRFAQQKQKHEFQKKNLMLEKEKAEFEIENINYEKQLIELEQQALRLQMNPHFIFNAITAIQGLYAGNKTTAAKEYLVRFSRLLRTLFDTARVPVVPLSKEIELVTDYIELSNPRLDHTISYTIDIQEGIIPEHTGIAPMLIQPFIENALLHGLLPLKREGHISLTVRKQDEMLIFMIEDNGVGRQESPPHRLGQPHGLSITRQRIDLLNRFENKAGNLVIEDLKDNEGKPRGTRVTFNTKFIILYDQDHYS